MLIAQDIAYTHPNKDLLFSDLNLVINKQDKVALLGNNGVGKSTLLKILAGQLAVSNGYTKASSKPYYVPQIFGQFNDYTIAQALQIEEKLKSLKEILEGNVGEKNLTTLDDDWTVEERCKEALSFWKLNELDLNQKLSTLSGGQKTTVFLAGMIIHQPDIVLMDEPSNHLDTSNRNILYDYVVSTSKTLVVVSHDRTLSNLLDKVYELSKHGITVYGGNYDFYVNQKMLESEAMNQEVRSKEKALRKAKETERESLERQQKLDARGKRKQEKEGLPTVSMNTFRNNAEKSTARIKGVHEDKVAAISKNLNQLRKELPAVDKMKMNLDNSSLHEGKILVTAKDLNFGYRNQLLWKQPLSFQLISGDRIVLGGLNGSGKTTLIKMILGELEPLTGTIERAEIKAIYIDQDYSLIKNDLTVYEQTAQFNSGVWQEHEIKIRLNRFLFTKAYWDKPCSTLSGGEKMRLMLCCLAIGNESPDLIVLDEPTNNLDIQNIEILTSALGEYRGTLIVVSHDAYFLQEINAERSIVLT